MGILGYQWFRSVPFSGRLVESVWPRLHFRRSLESGLCSSFVGMSAGSFSQTAAGNRAYVWPCVYLRWLAMTCVHFDRAQICTQVNTRFFTVWPPNASRRKLVSLLFSLVRACAQGFKLC